MTWTRQCVGCGATLAGAWFALGRAPWQVPYCCGLCADERACGCLERQVFEPTIGGP